MWVKSGSQPKHTLSFRINLTRISIWKYASTQFFPVLLLNKWNYSEMGYNTLSLHDALPIYKVLIWSWRLCSSNIDMTEKKKVWCEYFWHPFMRLLVHSWLSVFHVIYMWGVWFCLHYSTHIYCWEYYTPFQSDFICWVITPERFELKHTFK